VSGRQRFDVAQYCPVLAATSSVALVLGGEHRSRRKRGWMVIFRGSDLLEISAVMAGASNLGWKKTYCFHY